MTRALARAIVVALTVGLILRPVPLRAAEAIQHVVATTPRIIAGSPATFEIALTPSDAVSWAAGSYAVALSLLDGNGATIASAAPVTGEVVAEVGATTVVFITLSIPASVSSALYASARLTHGTSSETAPSIAVAIAAPASPTLTPAVPSRALPISGTLTTNEAYGGQQSQAGLLNLTGKLGNGQSFTTSAGLSSTPGGNKPVIAFQTQDIYAQVGTYAAAFDRDVFSGPTGTGFTLKRSWGAARFLQFGYLSGNHSTPNPYQIEALQYAFPVLGSSFGVTAGFENVGGDAQPGPFFFRQGAFLGAGFDAHAPRSSFVYGAHIGFVQYHDDLTNTQRSDDVVDLNLGFNVRRAQVALTYIRAGAYYANASAPGITPDRETAAINITLPIGRFNVSAGANGYRDQLPGSPLQSQTHFYTEAAGVTYAFRNGDALSLQATNSVQHQTGDPLAPFSGNDNTGLSYTTKRGPYQFQYSLTQVEQRDNAGHLLHVVTDAITVARAPLAHLTVSAGLNVMQNEASDAQASGLSNSANATVSYDRGPLTLSTQVNRSFSHPAIGVGQVPAMTYNYGVTVRPGRVPFSLSASVTENVGPANASSGALSLSRQF